MKKEKYHVKGIKVKTKFIGPSEYIAVIYVDGYIDTTTSSEFEKVLDMLLVKEKFRIIIDLQHVDYISSAGWGIFISEIKGIRENKGDLKLIGMIPDVYEVYELLEFHYIMKAYETLGEAVCDFIIEQDGSFSKIFSIVKENRLTELKATGRQLDKFPQEIIELSELKRLILTGNKFEDLPIEIGNLINLTYLDLSNNKFKKLPIEISNLINLTYLDLSNNKLLQLPQEIKNFKNLKKLYLKNNELPIPPEILDREKEPEYIINYYLELIGAKEKRTISEAKILIVGQGGVGKTQIINRILYNKFNERESKTEGIDIHKWKVNINEKEIKLNIWDFGGQEIMHATHQFFLTKRSLYVLVWDARQEDRYGLIDYWLKLIESFGADSPIIIVLNKIDLHNTELDRKLLIEKYPSIKGFVRVSCKTSENIDLLATKIKQELRTLKHIDDQLANTWFEVKEELEKMTTDYIEYDKYEKLCKEKNIDTMSQKNLIGFLHDLGVVLNFQEDRRLRDTNILNPDWVTNGVYAILNYEPLSKNGGVLDVNVLNSILSPNKYPEKKHNFIIDMMQKFELCFEFEGKRDVFLIPELLPKDQPEFVWPFEESISFQYQYDFLPTSVISRFIVRTRNLISKSIHTPYWKSGVVLEDEDNKALVIADRNDKRINIWVAGYKYKKRSFLAIICFHLKHIHGTIAKINATEMVPCICKSDCSHRFRYRTLIEMEKKGKLTAFCEETYADVSIKKLLDGIRVSLDELNEIQEHYKSPKLKGDSSMETRQKRLKQLKENLDLEYEKLSEFEKELSIVANAPAKFEIKQRIKLECIPNIRKYETEYAALLSDEISSLSIKEKDAEILIGDIEKSIEQAKLNNDQPDDLIQLLSEIRDKLNQPNLTATTKLKASLPIIPGILAYELHLDQKSSLREVWQRIKKKFVK